MERNFSDFTKVSTAKGPRIILTSRDREFEDQGLRWIFLIVVAKWPNKKAINDYLHKIWGI